MQVDNKSVPFLVFSLKSCSITNVLYLTTTQNEKLRMEEEKNRNKSQNDKFNADARDRAVLRQSFFNFVSVSLHRYDGM